MKQSLVLNFWKLPLALALGIAAVDRATKHWIAATWPAGSPPYPIIPHVFQLVHFRNTGGAWGILPGHTQFLSVVSVVVAVLLILYFDHLVEGKSERAMALALMLGGILGNLWDRLVLNGVVDFILLSYRSLHWPAFNVADSAITCGVVIFVVSTFWHGSENHVSQQDSA